MCFVVCVLIVQLHRHHQLAVPTNQLSLAHPKWNVPLPMAHGLLVTLACTLVMCRLGIMEASSLVDPTESGLMIMIAKLKDEILKL